MTNDDYKAHPAPSGHEIARVIDDTTESDGIRRGYYEASDGIYRLETQQRRDANACQDGKLAEKIATLRKALDDVREHLDANWRWD